MAEAISEKTVPDNSIVAAVDLVINSTAGAAAEVAPEGWYQIGLTGEWKGHPQGAYKLTKADLVGAVAYFNSRYAGHVDLPIDYEHQTIVSRLVGKNAEAAGWIDQVELRENGTQLFAHLKWTDEALALIRARKFRYLSPVFAPNRENATTGQRMAWTLDSVALTNKPFLTELPAVANSDAAASGVLNSAVAEEEDSAMDKLLATLATAMNEGRGSAPALDAKAVANSLGVPEDAKADVTVKAIAALLGAGDRASKQAALFANSLGVAPEADEAAISAALAQRSAAIAAKAPAAPAPEKQASGDAEVKLLAICNSLGATPDKPLADILALLSATRANPAQSAAEKLIENAISVDHKITPANRDAFVALAVKDFEGTRNILDSMPPILNSVTNAAGSEAAAGSEVLTAADKWACRQGGISEEAFLATRKRLSNQ